MALMLLSMSFHFSKVKIYLENQVNIAVKKIGVWKNVIYVIMTSSDTETFSNINF